MQVSPLQADGGDSQLDPNARLGPTRAHAAESAHAAGSWDLPAPQIRSVRPLLLIGGFLVPSA